ncbi:hypothetical protein SOVF_155300 [Spinacia oleracea]|nr:hypothetical protein SOVF_155300 [Spinacia oleracea]
MNCSMFLEHPIDVQAFKTAFSNSVMIKDPRFCSLLVRNPSGGDHWKRVDVNIDEHFILHYPSTKTETGSLDNEAAVNAYLSDIAVSTPLRKDKPLWEVHVLVELKCVVLRVHHSVGDGVSLMSMLSSCFGNKIISDIDVMKKHKKKIHENKKWKIKGLWGLIKSIWFTIVFGLRFLGRVLGVKNNVSVVSGGDGVELWPRKLMTAKFMIQDFKSIKVAIPSVTVNDVLLGVISHGLSKYVGAKSHKALQQSPQVTAILVVNLRGVSCLQEKTCTDSTIANSSNGLSIWRNKTGLMLLPLYCCNGLHPLDHVKTMKKTMDKKKNSYEAQISHVFLKLMTTYFGPKAASWCCHKVLCNTDLLISNIMGPSEEIAIANNPVVSIRVNISGQPQAITLHMVSYAGKADMQVMVAKDIISDPEFLVNCFQDSLVEMKTPPKKF